jgi:hypothetical protein
MLIAADHPLMPSEDLERVRAGFLRIRGQLGREAIAQAGYCLLRADVDGVGCLGRCQSGSSMAASAWRIRCPASRKKSMYVPYSSVRVISPDR